MKIALIGYGKMGKEIEQIAISRGHTIVLKVDINNAGTFAIADLKKVDVAIEFSTPNRQSIIFTNVLKLGYLWLLALQAGLIN